MTVWAETQGHRVNSFMFTWLSIPELPLPGCWPPALPLARRQRGPSDPNLFSEAASETSWSCGS